MGRSVLFNINVYTVIRKKTNIYNLDCGTLVAMLGMLAGILHPGEPLKQETVAPKSQREPATSGRGIPWIPALT
jgi:hypothetical protein